MQFSYSWLKTWTNPKISAAHLGEKMTMAGLEVESLNTAAPAFSGVVVAQIKSIEKHPDADRLNITQVDVGIGKLLQIVCGAPNVAVGIKVPCALIGAKLPDGMEIKKAKMRGQESNGMLCSARELGVAQDASGLLILDDDAPVGDDIRDYLDWDDAVFDLKITANRADCMSIKGLAREVHALTGCDFDPLGIPKTVAQSDHVFPTHILAPDDCGVLMTRVIEDVDSSIATPQWLKRRLERSGIDSISILVDIGNYVMLELGQPMHIYDLDTLTGSLNARRAIDGESLECINGKTVTLTSDTLVMADEKQVLGLAGLMGGRASAISDNTRNVLLESAFFAPHAIAGKSRQYGFSSDSAQRFERGVDYRLQEEAIERVSGLIVGLCGGKCGNIRSASGKIPEEITIAVRLTRIKQLLGINIDEAEVRRILESLFLNPQKTAYGFVVKVPSFRFDLTQEADLIEEIIRIHGYDAIIDAAPRGSMTILPLPEHQKNIFDVRRVLQNHGYSEVVTYSFVRPEWEQDFTHNENPIALLNPMNKEQGVMRSSLLGSLVQTLQHNLKRKQNRVRIFETAQVFCRNGSLWQQESKLALLAFGTALPEQWGTQTRKVDFYDVKSDLENLLVGDVHFEPLKDHPALHPGRAAKVICNHQEVGIIGEIHPKLMQVYDLPSVCIMAEINLQAALSRAKTVYRAVSKFPTVHRDLALVLDEAVSAHTLLGTLNAVSNDLIQEVTLFDLYKGVGLPEGKKSIAVRIALNANDRTLQDDEIELTMDKLLAAAQSIGATLRA